MYVDAALVFLKESASLSQAEAAELARKEGRVGHLSFHSLSHADFNNANPSQAEMPVPMILGNTDHFFKTCFSTWFVFLLCCWRLLTFFLATKFSFGVTASGFCCL